MTFKRSSSPTEIIQFVQNSTPFELPSDATGKMAIKQKGKYDDEPLASSLSWEKTGTGVDALYTFNLSFSNSAIDALLFADGNSANDKDTIIAMAEIEWLIDGNKHKTQTIPVIIENDVVRNNDGTPLELPTPLDWLNTNLTQNRIQAAITDDSAFRAAIGAGDNLTRVQSWNSYTLSGLVLNDGTTNHSQEWDLALTSFNDDGVPSYFYYRYIEEGVDGGYSAISLEVDYDDIATKTGRHWNIKVFQTLNDVIISYAYNAYGDAISPDLVTNWVLDTTDLAAGYSLTGALLIVSKKTDLNESVVNSFGGNPVTGAADCQYLLSDTEKINARNAIGFSDALASNIKSVNGESILGSGNLVVSGASDINSVTGLGTGVANALGLNTGTAGAFALRHAGLPGIFVFGDSIGTGTGASSTGAGNVAFRNGYAYLLQPTIGGPYFNYAKSGDAAADMSWLGIMPSTNPIGAGKDPLFIHEIGTNDVTRYTTDADRAKLFQRITTNNLAWLSIPAANKRFGQAATLSGFTVIDTVQKGLAVTSSTSGHTASFAITTLANSGIYVGYRITDGNAGTFEVRVDGTLQNDPYNGGTSWQCRGDNGGLISTANGSVDAVACVRLPVTASGSHTVLITHLGGGAVTVFWVGAPPASSSSNPTVIAVSPNHQNNANDSTVTTYAGYVSSIATTLAADGLNVIKADTRTALGTNYGTYYADTIHPNNAGHALMASTISAVIPQAFKTNSLFRDGSKATQDFVDVNPLNPSLFATPNGNNLSSSTLFNPGILLSRANGQCNWINFQPTTGLTVGFPNSGGVPGFSVGSYTPNGRPPSDPTALTSYFNVGSNGTVNFFPPNQSTTSSTTMSVSNNTVTMGGSYAGNAFSTGFANNYVSNVSTIVATSGNNFSSSNLWWRSNIWTGSATVDDIGFKNIPASGTNPQTYLTIQHGNGGSGTWGIDLSAATAPTKVRSLVTNGVIRFTGYTVATLPAGTIGDSAFVTDALTPAFGSTLVGGGAVVSKAFYNGTNWTAQ